MADALTAVDSILTNVKPEYDADKNIVALYINLALAYQAVDGARIGRTVEVDIWHLLSDSQKAALQEVQQVITTYIADTYFA